MGDGFLQKTSSSDSAVQDGDLGNDVPEPVAGDVEFQNVVRRVAP